MSQIKKAKEKTVNKIWNKWCDLSASFEIKGVEQCIEFDAWFTKLMRSVINPKES